MATLFVKHTVADYKKWRKGFDEFQSHAAEHGIKSAAVYQSAGNPNEVTVTHDFASVAAARTRALSTLRPSARSSMPSIRSRPPRGVRRTLTRRPSAHAAHGRCAAVTK